MVFGLKLGLPRKVQAEPPPRSDPVAAKTSVGGSTGGNSSTRALTVNEFVARTKRSRERGLEPTKPELVAYARYLGIDSITDGDLMWIAEESLNAPLPAEWTEHHDNHNRVFYYNVQTHASSWTHPLEQLHRDTYKSIVNFRSGDLSRDDQGAKLDKLRRQCEDAERGAHRELQAWTEHVDDQGQKFYYNHEHKRSVWTDPRPAHCHELYLQMKALRVLSRHGTGIGGPGINSARGPDPLSADLRSSVDRDGQRINRLKHHALSAAAIQDTEIIGDEARKEERRKKKKNRRQDAEIEDFEDQGRNSHLDMGGISEERHLKDPLSKVPRMPADLSGSGGMALGPIGTMGLGEWKNPLLDLKKPSTAAVNEVRQAIGVSHDSMSPRQHLPGLGGPAFNPFEGDGLGTMGRARVRAGIKLEPIK